MWGVIVKAAGGIFGSWVDLKKAKNEATAERAKYLATQETDWDMEAMRNAKTSWKDEFITIIWFAPLIMAWSDPDKAQDWVDFVGQLPVWYQTGMIGILCASFGLRWLFKNKALKMGKK